MTNSWILHVKKYASDNNKSYGCAISDPLCKASYNKPVKKTKKELEDEKIKVIRLQTITMFKNKVVNMKPDEIPMLRGKYNSYTKAIRDQFRQKYPNTYKKLFD